MKKFPWVILIVLMIIPTSHECQEQPSMQFDYKSAEAMIKVFYALNRQDKVETIQKLLDDALMYKAYNVSHERYTDPARSKENQVTLEQFRQFMLSLGEAKLTPKTTEG